MDKKTWNAENVKQIVDVLTGANYRCCGLFTASGHGVIEMWIGPGSVPVIGLQLHANDDGFEVWTPLVQSIRMDETVAALRAATGVGPKL
jgi:hypothetical protein